VSVDSDPEDEMGPPAALAADASAEERISAGRAAGGAAEDEIDGPEFVAREWAPVAAARAAPASPTGPLDMTEDEAERLHVLRRLGGGASDAELLARIRAEARGSKRSKATEKKRRWFT
jgi:hypothetical protein